MKTLKELVESNVVGFGISPNRPTEDTIAAVEDKLQLKFGAQMREYLISFGCLWKDDVELYGVNELQKADSDLVKTTLNVREYYERVEGMVVVDNLGDGQYVFCDCRDMMFKMPVTTDLDPVPLNEDLSHYICHRLA